MWCGNEREWTICYHKKQIDVSFSWICPVIDLQIHLRSTATLTMLTKFMINNRTDAWKTDINLLNFGILDWLESSTSVRCIYFVQLILIMCTKDICGHMSIDTLNQNSIDTQSVPHQQLGFDTWLTHPLTDGWQSRLWTDCWLWVCFYKKI